MRQDLLFLLRSRMGERPPVEAHKRPFSVFPITIAAYSRQKDVPLYMPHSKVLSPLVHLLKPGCEEEDSYRAPRVGLGRKQERRADILPFLQGAGVGAQKSGMWAATSPQAWKAGGRTLLPNKISLTKTSVLNDQAATWRPESKACSLTLLAPTPWPISLGLPVVSAESWLKGQAFHRREFTEEGQIFQALLSSQSRGSHRSSGTTGQM